MSLNEMIYKRMSVRKYTQELVGEAMIHQIYEFLRNAKPLYPEISIRTEILGKENIRCILPWIPNQAIVFYSEEKEGYLENAGFIFQQLDLYLQEQGLGTCWLGMGKLDSYAKSQIEDGLEYVIMLSVGYPKEQLRTDISQFKRKELREIADKEDARLEPARLAPSSTNSQPWYFTHQDDTIHVYCSKKGLLRHRILGDMNRIDIGIALSHMYVANPETFQFFTCEDAAEVSGHGYMGSFRV